ncbi:hypothetical protein ILUMI_25807, partial [Ignelater luminosus]
TKSVEASLASDLRVTYSTFSVLETSLKCLKPQPKVIPWKTKERKSEIVTSASVKSSLDEEVRVKKEKVPKSLNEEKKSRDF